jgi:hypothetical protein
MRHRNRSQAVQLRIEKFEDTTVLRKEQVRNKHTRTEARKEETRVGSSPATVNSGDGGAKA